MNSLKKRFVISLLLLFGVIIIILIIVIIKINVQQKDTTLLVNNNENESSSSNVEYDETSNKSNVLSIAYSKEIIAKNGVAVATMFLENPIRATQNIKFQIRISDYELLSKIGKTGRKSSEDKRIRGKIDYDAKLENVVIVKSDIINPGFRAESLKLKPLPDGTILPKGEYNAFYTVFGYDVETNKQLPVSTHIPIVIIIEN